MTTSTEADRELNEAACDLAELSVRHARLNRELDGPDYDAFVDRLAREARALIERLIDEEFTRLEAERRHE